MTAGQRWAGLLALTLCLAGCAGSRFGESDARPYWRRPGPDLIEPQERLPVPDDGFRANLAALEDGRGRG